MHRQPGQAESADAELSETRLPGAELPGAEPPEPGPAGAELTGTELPGTRPTEPDLAGTGLAGTGMTGPELTRTGPAERDLAGTELTGTGQAVPASLLGAAMERMAPEPPVPDPDARLASVREFLTELRQRAAGAASWLESSDHYARLLNSAGLVPVTARFDARDLAFLGRAREDLLGFADLGLRLADLHRPLDGGGATSDPANPALRCRSCMWRWPCPTFRLMTEYLTERGLRSPDR